MRKRGGTKMNAATNILPFTHQNKKNVRKSKRYSNRPIPFSKMSEKDQKESVEAMKDE